MAICNLQTLSPCYSAPPPPQTMGQPKSLLITENFPPGVGGSGRWFWELYRRLPTDSIVIAAGAQPKAKVFDRGHSLNLQRVPLTFPTRFIRPQSFGPYRLAMKTLIDVVRTEGIQRVQAGRCLPEGLLALAVSKRTGIPYTCFAHGEEVNLSNDETSPGWLERRVYGSRELGLIVGLVLSQARLVIANSQNTRSILVDRWQLPAERVEVLNPGVDTSLFNPVPRSADIRHKLGWEDRPVILTVGRLQKRKGHDLLIRALPDLLTTLPDVLYAIAGSGEELESLRRLVADTGLGEHVQFLTNLDDQELAECYQQCDLFVLPNRDLDGDIEGFGMVLLEAQACGKPVIAGSTGGTAETMSTPETGLLVDVEEHQELVRVLTDLLIDPERLQTMGTRARSWIEERFDWDVLGHRAQELFDRQESRQASSPIP